MLSDDRSFASIRAKHLIVNRKVSADVSFRRLFINLHRSREWTSINRSPKTWTFVRSGPACRMDFLRGELVEYCCYDYRRWPMPQEWSQLCEQLKEALTLLASMAIRYRVTRKQLQDMLDEVL